MSEVKVVRESTCERGSSVGSICAISVDGSPRLLRVTIGERPQARFPWRTPLRIAECIRIVTTHNVSWLYDGSPGMWQNSVGKMCILYAQNLKEAISVYRNRFH